MRWYTRPWVSPVVVSYYSLTSVLVLRLKLRSPAINYRYWALIKVNCVELGLYQALQYVHNAQDIYEM